MDTVSTKMQLFTSAMVKLQVVTSPNVKLGSSISLKRDDIMLSSDTPHAPVYPLPSPFLPAVAQQFPMLEASTLPLPFFFFVPEVEERVDDLSLQQQCQNVITPQYFEICIYRGSHHAASAHLGLHIGLRLRTNHFFTGSVLYEVWTRSRATRARDTDSWKHDLQMRFHAQQATCAAAGTGMCLRLPHNHSDRCHSDRCHSDRCHSDRCHSDRCHSDRCHSDRCRFTVLQLCEASVLEHFFKVRRTPSNNRITLSG